MEKGNNTAYNMPIERKKRIRDLICILCDNIKQNAIDFCEDPNANFLSIAENIEEEKITLDSLNEAWALLFVEENISLAEEYLLFDYEE